MLDSCSGGSSEHCTTQEEAREEEKEGRKEGYKEKKGGGVYHPRKQDV